MLVHQLAMTFQESWTEPVQEPDLWYRRRHCRQTGSTTVTPASTTRISYRTNQKIWPFVRAEMFVSPYHLIHSRTNWFFSLVSPLQQCLITYRAIFS